MSSLGGHTVRRMAPRWIEIKHQRICGVRAKEGSSYWVGKVQVCLRGVSLGPGGCLSIEGEEEKFGLDDEGWVAYICTVGSRMVHVG